MADPVTVEAAVSAADAMPAGIVEQLIRFMDDGGPVLYVLLVISVLALTLIIAKLIQFGMLRLYAHGFVEPALRAWQNGESAAALARLERERNPIARVIEVALRGSVSRAGNDALIREEVTRVAGLQLDTLRSGLRPLALIANISPLIGLLGTVLGMINAFQTLQTAGNRVDPSILSGGIWVALLTTAAGLIIAIPAAAVHNWMEGIVYRAQRAMEDGVTRIFTLPALRDGLGADAGAKAGAGRTAGRLAD
jgi:biopolymer transport protein ExbB